MDILQKPQIISHAEQNLNYTIYDVKWIPASAKFVTIGIKPNGTGIVQTYCMNQGKFQKLSEFVKGNPFKCGTFGASSLRNRHLATGDFKGRVQVWDLENTMQPIHSYAKHKYLISTIDGVAGTTIGCGAPEIATGSKDTVMVWDVRIKNDPVAIMQSNDNGVFRECWAVAFGNSYNAEQRVLCAGFDNGDLKMYDLRMNKIRWETNVKNGICSVQFDRKDTSMNKLLVTTLESFIHVFDLKVQHPRKGFPSVSRQNDISTIWFGTHLPQNRDIFMTAGAGGSICLWKYSYPENRIMKDAEGLDYGNPGRFNLLQNFILSSQPVSALDWHPEKTGLAVCASFDQTVRVIITTKLHLQ